MNVITKTLKRSDNGVAGLHTFLGDGSLLLPDKDWREMGKPEEVTVQITPKPETADA